MTPTQLEGVRLLAGRGYSDREIGESLGVSGRTVRRWRARYGIPSTWTQPRHPHGTRARYAAGCRACAACRQAAVAYNAAARRRAAYARWNGPAVP